MARRVEPQPRDPGGRFAKRSSTEPGTEPSTAPGTVEHGGEHGDAAVIEYPEPQPARRARKSTAKKTARAGKNRQPRARSGTVKTAAPGTVEHGGEHGEHGEHGGRGEARPLGFLDGLGAPLGLRRG